MNFDQLINRIYTEAHITDVMPKTFFEFVKKYKKLKNDPYLFVQFSDYASSNLQLGGYSSPDHQDPIGVYGYPLKYVIEYPADIRYGSNAKYLRVLRNTSPMDTLLFTDLPEWRAERLMRDMGLDPWLLKQIGKHFKINRNSAMYGKQLFGCVQYDFVDGKPVIRSGQEQTKLLRKVCKSVEDRAKNRNTAIINPSEPQQIIFFTRDCFKVEEVFQLRQEKHEKNLMGKKDSDVVLAQRIANYVFGGLGDSIKGQTESKHEKNSRSHGTFLFFSKGGMKLTVSFENEIPRGWKFGMPTTKFKDFKSNTRSFPTLELVGPRGTATRKYSIAQKASEIGDDFVRYYKHQDLDPGFKPTNKKSYEEEKLREEERIKQERMEKDKAERIKEETEFRQDYLSMAMKKHNINIPLLPIEEIHYFSVFRFILQALYHRVNEAHPMQNTALPEDLEYVWSENTSILPYLVKKYGEETINSIKYIFNKIALGNPVWRNVYPWIVQMPK